jgi:hypothetical protein
MKKPDAHREEDRERKRKYRETHREEDRERHRKYRETHREEVKERQRKYRETHREEVKERNREYRETHREEEKERQRKANYGLTPDKYQVLYKTQNGCCAICREPMVKINIDHDHKTGKVRGLLCERHNRGLGFFQDDIKRLSRAIAYLKAHKRREGLRVTFERRPAVV